MEALLKRYYTKVQYFVGSVMNVADLHRIQVRGVPVNFSST